MSNTSMLLTKITVRYLGKEKQNRAMSCYKIQIYSYYLFLVIHLVSCSLFPPTPPYIGKRKLNTILVFKHSPCCSNDKFVFWVFPWRLSIKSRRFGTLCRFHLQQAVKCVCEDWLVFSPYYTHTSPTVEDGTDTVFRNVGS